MLVPTSSLHLANEFHCSLERGLGHRVVGRGAVEKVQLLDRTPTRGRQLVDGKPLQRLELLVHAAERTPGAVTPLPQPGPPRAAAADVLPATASPMAYTAQRRQGAPEGSGGLSVDSSRLRRMTLDPATVDRVSRALRGYSMNEHPEDRANALDALSDLILDAQMQGDSSAAGQLEAALELAGLGPAGANEADNIVGALANGPSSI